MIVFISFTWAQTYKSNVKNKILSFSDFESAMPPIRYVGNPIITHGGWAGGQVQEPCILENPKDSTKLIMFYAGANLVLKDGGKGAIAKAWAYKSSPYVWYQYKNNPILTPDSIIHFESFSVRLDCVLYNRDTDEYWIYYTGRTGDSLKNDAIGLATCKAGINGYSFVTKANIKKYPGNPILTGTGQGRNDGTYVSQSSVIIHQGMYYMYYSYRNSDILPGIRYALSKDGKIWLKKGKGDILSRSTGGPDSKYFEWKQCFKAFNKYIIIWEAFNGIEWSACMASSNFPKGPWTKSKRNPIFKPSGIEGSFDKSFVATPAFYLINHKWYLFYQGANNGGNYNYNTWDLGIAVLK